MDLFDATGLWLSTEDRNGNAKTATYSGSELDLGRLPRRAPGGLRLRRRTTGKLQTIDEVGVDGVTIALLGLHLGRRAT